jgi:hypothetical protein
MEDMDPLEDALTHWIDNRRPIRRVRAGACDETTAVFRRSMYGADGAFTNAPEYCNAVERPREISWFGRFLRWMLA